MRDWFRKVLDFAAEIILFISVILLYAGFSVLWAKSGGLYSAFLCHYLQVDALLKGKLLLSPNPFGNLPDFLWTGHGMSQNFGLGIPLLQLPFEAAARWCGFSPFPDRLILFFYIIVMIVLLNLGIKSAFKILGPSFSGIMEFGVRWFLVLWVVLGVPMMGLLQWHAYYFEETIYYGCLCSCILLSLLWIYMRRPSPTLFLALCLTAGLAYLIRPTLLAYGTATVLTASIYTYQKRRNLKLVLTGFLFFGLGCCVNLIFNYYRFGNPFEFGYSTNFSAIPVVDYSLRFGYPFQHEPLWTASKELINALFFNLSYRSPTFRFREGAFAVFDIFYLAVLVLGIFLLPFFLLPKKSKQLYDRAGLIGLTLCWGLISFGILFAFYLHFPSLAGRYLSDFSMALNALFMSLVLASLLLFSSKNRLKNGLLGLGFLVLLSGAFYFCNKEDLVFFRAYQKGGVDTFSMNRSEFIGLQNSFHWQMMRNIHLPYRLDCHHEPVAQQVGWHMSGDCSVEASTTIFLPASRCLTVNYSVSQPDVVLDVRVKRNFTFLKLTGTREFKDHPGPFYPLATEVEEKFCSQASPAYSTALYTIGWVPVADLKEGAYPVVLHSVKVSN